VVSDQWCPNGDGWDTLQYPRGVVFDQRCVLSNEAVGMGCRVMMKPESITNLGNLTEPSDFM
jgi:hypothetical protein